jgi:uncharacterized protein with HEPN domain
MKPRDRNRLLDIVRAADFVASFIEGFTLDKFLADALVQSAVIRQLQIAGEASRQISPEFKSGNPHIPWAKIIGMRNVIVHDYNMVDLEIVWSAATKFLPQVRDAAVKSLRAGGIFPDR